jgi:hypothetical protein
MVHRHAGPISKVRVLDEILVAGASRTLAGLQPAALVSHLNPGLVALGLVLGGPWPRLRSGFWDGGVLEVDGRLPGV